MILTGELSFWSLWCPAIQGGNWRLFTYIFALTAHFSISPFMDLGKVLFLHQSRRCLHCPVMCQILGNSWQGVQHFAQILQTLTAGRHTSCNFDKVATCSTDRHRHQFSWVFVPARQLWSWINQWNLNYFQNEFSLHTNNPGWMSVTIEPEVTLKDLGPSPYYIIFHPPPNKYILYEQAHTLSGILKKTSDAGVNIGISLR